MPHKLVDLPRDVLDPCLKELLPPLEPLPMQGDSLKIPIPVDLLRLQLVCKTLYSLALPWVWRRLTMAFGPIRSSRSMHWKHCIAHPGRFVHIRLFRLDLTYTDISENILAIQSSLNDCISLMSNLRMLILNGPPPIYLESNAHITMKIDEVYFALCSRPRLHTLVVSTYLPMRLRSLDGTSLKRLITHNSVYGPLEFLGVAPFLESLAFFGETIINAESRKSHLPWDTLRDLSFHFFCDVVFALQDFTAWKVALPDIRCPLTEIYWEDIDVSPAAVEQLLTAFEGQNIRTFSLHGIPSIDADFISRVARAFPRLQKLTLMAEHEGSDGEWGAPSSIADSLVQMPLLNFFCGNLLASEFETGSSEGCYRDAMRLIAERCHALECLIFALMPGDFVVAYAIERDDRGAYVGGVRLENDGQDEDINYLNFSSSGWRSAKYDDI